MHHELPKAFFDKYLYDLSHTAYVTLSRFYYFYLQHRDKGKDIDVPVAIFKSQVLASDDNEVVENVWGELDWHGLVQRQYKKNIYELILTTIHKDSGIEKNEKFRLHLAGKPTIKRKKPVDEYMKAYVERAVSRFGKLKIREKIKRVINGIEKYLSETKGKVEIGDIGFFLDPFYEADDDVVEEVCDIYLESHYGTKPIKYIHGILKNKVRDRADKKPISKNSEAPLDRYENEREESDLMFAIELATGKAEGTRTYKTLCEKRKQFDRLRELYRTGVAALKKEGRSNEIYKDYDWLG